MKTKKLFVAALVFIFPVTTVFGYSPFNFVSASTFSLVVYDEWQQPSKPLPDGWSYLLKLPATLQTNGYYGESFKACEHHQYPYPGFDECSIVIAHRGTTSSFWDTYADFEYAMGHEPYQYYMNALEYVDLVKKYVKSTIDPTTLVYFYTTGHSLGAILTELVVGSKIIDRDAPYAVVFDSPGTKPIIKLMVDQKQLPEDALTNVPRRTNYYFSGINAINTFNEQMSPDNTNYEFAPEDFKGIIPLSTIGSPGKLYYFKHYSLHQHEMINFYNQNHPKTVEEHKVPLTNANIVWPIGFSASYKFYTTFGQDYYRNRYWSFYMWYMWNNNPDLHVKYKEDANAFAQDFVAHLKDDLDNKPIMDIDNTATHSYFSLDDEIINHQKPVTPITAKKRPTLYDITNNNYDGHSTERRQIYTTASDNKKLYYAVMCGDVNFAEKLIQETNANTNTKHGKEHYSLLQMAIMMGYLDMVQLLLKYHADPELADDQGNAALHTVAKERYEDADDYAKALIAGGANSNAKNKAGQTPAMLMEKHYPEKANDFIKVIGIK